MALPNGFVGAPISGGIYSGDTTATLPADAIAAISDADLDKLGYLSDEGYSLTRDRSTDDIRRWGGQIFRTVQTEFSETLSFTFLEGDKVEVLKEVFGADNVTGTAETGISIKHNEQTLSSRAFVFDMKDGDKRRRLVVPNGQITETEDITYSHSDVVRYGVTVTCYADDDGNCAYEYIAQQTAGSGGSGE